MTSAERRHVNGDGVQEPRQSLGDLLGSLMKHVAGLVKDEAALAKAEIREKIRVYSSAAVFAVIGIGLGLLAGMALLAAGIVALSAYTGLVVSSVIFGVALGLPAIFLVVHGLRQLKRAP